MLVIVRARAAEHDDGHERKESTMQSIEIRRSGTHRFGITVVAIGVLAIMLAVTGVLIDVSGDSHGGVRTETQALQRPEPGERGRYLERNTKPLDTGVHAAERGLGDAEAVNDLLELNMTPPGRIVPTARSFADMRFLEMNTLLPGTAHPPTQSYDEARFLEMNTALPGMATPVTLSYAELRFLEVNQLPDGAQNLQISDASQPIGPK
jgi:hypothetical protein